MTTREPPIQGMQKIPYGWEDPLLMGAFMACVTASASQEDLIESFQTDTGLNLSTFIRRSPIERMVDKATGADRDVFLKWIDWVAEKVWGLAKPPEEDFSETIPTEAGLYWIKCMENDGEPEPAKVFMRGEVLMCELDSLGTYGLDAVHSNMSDVLWAKAI